MVSKEKKTPLSQNKRSAGSTAEVTVVPPPARELLAWRAQARPFIKRSREYFSTLIAIAFLLIVILLFVKEWLLIGVIITLVFLAYVLGTVPPPQVDYKLTTRGVVVGDKTYKWSQLSRFWFSKRLDSQIVHLETFQLFPRQLQLVLKDQSRDEVKEIIEKYLILEKPKKDLIDKAAGWLEKNFPLEIR